MKQVKLAVLRARHDTSRPPIPDQACIEMMMVSPTRHSVLQYWEDVTDGYLDFADSSLMPWVDIVIDPADTSRDTQASKAYEATKALNGGDLDGYDGFIVLTWPGQMSTPNPKFGQPNQPMNIMLSFDGGAGSDVHGQPSCALPVMTSNHTFMCHEVGHVLGFKHSYGWLNNGIDWDGVAPFSQSEVYGDPYDLMSSASFGSRWLDPAVSHYSGDPAFAGPVIAAWPNPSAFSMGPAPARAHVHLWDKEALKPGHVRHFQMPALNQTVSFRLVPALGGQGGTQLAVLHPMGEDADGRGRVYVEYRQKGGWDSGLDVYGNDLARQGVIVHALADATADGVRCWYRGRVLTDLELDSDLAVKGTPLTVRVTDADDQDGGYAEVEVSVGAVRGIDIHTRGTDDVITITNPQPMGTPCGDQITYGTCITQSQYFYQPISYGFGGEGAADAAALKASWTVAGVALPGTSGSIDAATADGTFTIEFSVDPITAELSLSSRGGEKYRADVTVTMTEADGSGATAATTVFAPKGYFDGYAPGDVQKLARCTAKYARRARLRLRDLLVPPGPDPYSIENTDRINRVRLQQAFTQVAEQYPGPASALSALHALRYGVYR